MTRSGQLSRTRREDREVKRRLAEMLSAAGILSFLIGLVGEVWVDIFQPITIRSGYFMTIAIPLMANLFLLGAAIRGSVKLRRIELSKSESPAKFFLLLAIAFVVVNSIVLTGVLTQ